MLSQLTVSLGPSEGRGGHDLLPILFTKHERVDVLAARLPGRLVGWRQRRAPDRRAGAPAARHDLRTIALAPGAYGSATYGQAEALNYPKARCLPESARGLRVYAPNVHASVILPLKHLACSTTTAHDSTSARLGGAEGV